MRVFIILLILAVCALVSGGQSELNNSNPPPKTPEIDIFVFEEQWLDFTCYLWNRRDKFHTCSLPKPKQWSILGLWPEKNGTKRPNNCISSVLFDIDQLAPIRTDLEAKFVSINDQENITSLWKHIWESHGTCGAGVAEIDSPIKYFNKTIELFDKYDVHSTLSFSNITIGNEYNVQKLLDAIERGFGKRGRIMCTKDHKKSKQYLSSVQICFDKTFNLIDCDGVRHLLTNCPRKKPIAYSNFQNDLI